MKRQLYGDQPVRLVLDERKLSCRAIAKMVPAISPASLTNSAAGRSRPTKAIREKLPVILDVPLDQLFTPEALAADNRRDAEAER